MSDGRDGRVVLIVQEELVIRMDVVEAFETGGFKIFQADTAEKAIDVLQSEPTIRVVFTDVDLPGTMDGLTLAHYVRHRWPPTILLVGSGRASCIRVRCRPMPGLSASRIAQGTSQKLY
jgi:CheY-like chemotaxis protein